MSASEEDIQASALMTALKPKSLQADTAHYFRNRRILQVTGDLDGLEKIATGTAPGQNERGRFISLLTEEGCLDADVYLAPFEGSLLVDVHADLVEQVADRLTRLSGVTNIDRFASDRWRVFGELPDQKGADSPFHTLRFADTRRRELGNRVFRDAAEPEGFDWRHARKWDGQAMRLGVLPDHRCVIGKGILPHEAGYHRLLGLPVAVAPKDIHRRVLPVRIDPRSSKTIPVMAQAPLVAEGREIGLMLDQEGVCGIAIITLEPWREAVGVETRITCLGEVALISWPTWLSSESEGRVGPAADQI
jgi:hypothetical protein